ncbi:MAG: FAD-dependent oxidoreductase [Candidatus Korobacteraceae bacterium]|jgi:hypothetical protein
MNSAIGYKEAEVVIAGAGPGGALAAIAAGRMGAKVLLIDQLGFPGGMFSGGNMSVTNCWPWAGIGKEIFDRLKARGAAISHPNDPPNYPLFHFGAYSWRNVPYDPEAAKLVLFEILQEAGVSLLLHSYVTGAIMEGNQVRGVVVENKSGRQVICGKVICDGTADGDVAASAGAEFIKGQDQGDGTRKLFPMTMLVRLSHVDWPRVGEYSKTDTGWDKAIARATAAGDLPYYKARARDMVPYVGHPRPEMAHLWWEDGALLWGGTVDGVDGTDADSLTHAEVECRKQWVSELAFLRKYIPGFAECRVEDSGVTVGVRISRNIVGEYMYTGYDILEEREFEDTVAYITPLYLGVPYGCLLPKQVDNLLIAGRCISTTPGQTTSGPTLGSYNNMKSIPTVMTYGEAAGTAAALSVRQGVTPRQLNRDLLVSTLKKNRAVVDRAERDAMMESERLPDGTSFKPYFERRQAELRAHWEERGYKFEKAKQVLVTLTGAKA